MEQEKVEELTSALMENMRLNQAFTHILDCTLGIISTGEISQTVLEAAKIHLKHLEGIEFSEGNKLISLVIINRLKELLRIP